MFQLQLQIIDSFKEMYCFMSKEWKASIRNKRKYAIQFAKDRTPENFELKKKQRNIATRERRKALTAYWYKKSKEMKSKTT